MQEMNTRQATWIQLRVDVGVAPPWRLLGPRASCYYRSFRAPSSPSSSEALLFDFASLSCRQLSRENQANFSATGSHVSPSLQRCKPRGIVGAGVDTPTCTRRASRGCTTLSACASASGLPPPCPCSTRRGPLSGTSPSASDVLAHRWGRHGATLAWRRVSGTFRWQPTTASASLRSPYRISFPISFSISLASSRTHTHTYTRVLRMARTPCYCGTNPVARPPPPPPPPVLV